MGDAVDAAIGEVEAKEAERPAVRAQVIITFYENGNHGIEAHGCNPSDLWSAGHQLTVEGDLAYVEAKAAQAREAAQIRDLLSKPDLRG